MAKKAKSTFKKISQQPKATKPAQMLSDNDEMSKSSLPMPNVVAPEVVGSKSSPVGAGQNEPSDTTDFPKISKQPEKHQLNRIPRILRRKYGKRLLVTGLLMLLFVGGLQVVSSRLNHDSGADPATQKLINRVAKLAILPSKEKPSVTTVVDTSKLNQSFLQEARKGDKVLLYFQAGKAFVYRPSTNQIVNIGPLSQPTAKLFLRNGTTASSMPASIRGKLGQTTDYTIVSQDTAVKKNYEKTLVVDIAGNRPDIAARIAKQIGGIVTGLPAGESPPDADFLIIAGADSL